MKRKLVKKECKQCDNKCDHKKMTLKVSLGTVDEGFRNNKVNQHLCSIDKEIIILRIDDR